MDNIEFEIVIPGGKRYALRDDGYRVYARLVDPVAPEVLDGETCLFEYKHSDCDDARTLVEELLLRASVLRGRNEINTGTQGYEPDQTPMSVSASWKSDGTGFRE